MTSNKPVPPCPIVCPKRKVGCRSECPDWQIYEKEHFAYLAEKEKIFRYQDEHAEFRKSQKGKSIRARRKW